MKKIVEQDATRGERDAVREKHFCGAGCSTRETLLWSGMQYARNCWSGTEYATATGAMQMEHDVTSRATVGGRIFPL